MGPVERKLTAITTVVVFAAGIWVVIFAPFMVNDDGNIYGRHVMGPIN